MLCWCLQLGLRGRGPNLTNEICRHVGTYKWKYTYQEAGTREHFEVGAGASLRSFVWGDGFIGTQAHLLPKVSFSSDFGHFILKMLENAKF